MTTLKRDSIENFFSQVPTELLFLFLSPVVLFPIGYYLLSPPSIANSRSVLMVLAGALASVLAIVFSVTILSIQLVASKYTARAAFLFTEDPLFRFTFGVFIAAVGLDILFLYTLPSAISNLFSGALLAVIGINISAIVSLYYFIQSSAELSSPEGTLSALDRHLTPDRYQADVQKYLADGSESYHPLHAAYGMTISAMSNNESATAETAVKKLRVITLRSLKELDADSDSQDNNVKQRFKPILEDYLPEIIVSASERDESTVVRRAVSAESTLAQTGVDTQNEFVASMGMSGFSDVLQEVKPVEDSYSLINRTFGKMGDLVKKVAEKPGAKTVDHMLLTMRSRIDFLFRGDVDVWLYRDIVRDYFDDLEEIQDSLLEHYADEIAGQNIDWKVKGLVGDYEERDAAAALNRVKELVVKTTNHCLRYKDQKQVDPFTAGNFRDSWTNFCIQASNTALKEYGIAWTQLMIETGYCLYVLNEDDQTWWARAVAEVMREGDSSVVEEAFNRIAEDTSYSRSIRIQKYSYLEEDEKSTVMDIYEAITAPEEFEDWVGEFRRNVQSRYESLSDDG